VLEIRLLSLIFHFGDPHRKEPLMETVVAKTTELQDGQMKEAAVGDLKIVLARVGGRYYAIGGTCPHYGGPLAEGLLVEHRVKCPWHQAAFDITTGDLLRPPAMDPMTRFAVRVEGEDILVDIPEGAAEKRPLPAVRRDSAADPRVFAIVGAGAAGSMAAETLRAEGFRGRVVMISRESHLPYDRTALSKGYLRSETPGEVALRSEDFYDDRDIERLNRRVVRLDAKAKRLEFDDGSDLRYDKVLIATGGSPQPLNIPGADLRNIRLLRTFNDGQQIRELIEQYKKAVVIGSSFIGMEVGSSAAMRGLAVEVVAPGAAPFEKSLGEKIGRALQALHEDNGVRFHLGRRAVRFEGDGRVRRVVLDGGEALEADLVIVGIGVRPATDFVEGIALHSDGGIPVDAQLRVNEDTFAAGDVARFPDWRTGEPIRVEHWQLAQAHGRVAARNMAGRHDEFRDVPFFWTNQFKVGTQYVGYAGAWDDIVTQGDLGGQYLVFFIKNHRPLAVAGRGPAMLAAGELIRLGRLPSVEELRAGEVDLIARLRSA
jgi:NADPH-dependent 2,4-dienoyl-CoA reductase/sulfur reductase-like enzyme/nitrite reductase/ring-hydroxylating ferredoxin subunit